MLSLEHLIMMNNLQTNMSRTFSQIKEYTKIWGIMRNVWHIPSSTPRHSADRDYLLPRCWFNQISKRKKFEVFSIRVNKSWFLKENFLFLRPGYFQTDPAMSSAALLEALLSTDNSIRSQAEVKEHKNLVKLWPHPIPKSFIRKVIQFTFSFLNTWKVELIVTTFRVLF